MRVSPVAWAAHDLEFKYLLKMAEETASCSHNHPEGIKGAQTVALAIQYGIELPCYHPNFTQEHVKELTERCAEFGDYNINIKKEAVINRFDETCQGTVPGISGIRKPFAVWTGCEKKTNPYTKTWRRKNITKDGRHLQNSA
jgi:ADP-ribosylglycohydrolase